MKKWLFFWISISSFPSFSQVGINTTTPSNASVLHVESSNDDVYFGGFLPPKVSLTQRNNIAVGAGDDGMMIFVIDGDNRYLQIYNENRNRWENVYWFSATVPAPVVITAWDVNGLPGGTNNFGPSPFDATTSIAQVAVAGLTRSSGVTTSGTGAANAWGGTGWEDSTDMATAIAANNFITFTLSPNAENTLSLSSIEPYNIRRSAAGPTTGQWQYSINGVDYFNIGSSIIWGGTTTAAGNLQDAIDLSGITALQNINSLQTVTFRIVNWDASDPGGTWYINRLSASEGEDDIIIMGSVTP